MIARVSVLGAGAWGATLAWLIAREGREVALWSSSADKRDAMRMQRAAPGVPLALPAAVHIVDTLREAMAPGLVFLAIPPGVFRAVVRDFAVHVRPEHRLVHTVKALEPGGASISSVLLEETCALQVGALVGPVLPKEVWRGDEMAAVVGSRYRAVCVEAGAVLNGPSLKVYGSTDLVGVEVAGAMRTPIGLAAGMLRGAGLGRPSLAFLLTRAVAEAGRLAVALGGQAGTTAGLAGIGDWLVTADDAEAPVSVAGRRMAAGQPCDFPEAESRVRTLLELARRKKVDMPITEAVGAVLDGKPMAEALAGLMSRRMSFES